MTTNQKPSQLSQQWKRCKLKTKSKLSESVTELSSHVKHFRLIEQSMRNEVKQSGSFYAQSASRSGPKKFLIWLWLIALDPCPLTFMTLGLALISSFTTSWLLFDNIQHHVGSWRICLIHSNHVQSLFLKTFWHVIFNTALSISRWH